MELKRYGLMDIGSNTIHAVIYELDGQKWKKVLSEKEYREAYEEFGGKFRVGMGAEAGRKQPFSASRR